MGCCLFFNFTHFVIWENSSILDLTLSGVKGSSCAFFFRFLLGAIGDSASVKTRVVFVQSIAVETINTVVTVTSYSDRGSSSKKNVSTLVAKKLLQPSNEKCLDILYQLLQNKASFLHVLSLLSELCVVSKDLSMCLLQQEKWRVSFAENLESCRKESCKETSCLLRLLCMAISRRDRDVPAEYVD